MKLAEFVCERNGKFSALRLQFHAWNIAVLAVWINVCLGTNTLAPIDPTLLILLGINNGSFGVHRFAESKDV